MGFFSQQGKWRDLHRALFIWGVIKYFQHLVVHLICVWVTGLRTGRGGLRYGIIHGREEAPANAQAGRVALHSPRAAQGGQCPAPRLWRGTRPYI